MTIDTNIIIAYLAGEKTIINILDDWRKQGGFLYLPAIVEAEVLSFAQFSLQERRITEKFLEENFISIPFDRRIARLAGVIRSSKKIKLPDAAIAATALFTKTPLLTRNDRDFKKVPGLELLAV